MIATAEELPDVSSTMQETVIYEPKDLSGSGPTGPGLSDMRQANPSQANGRYTFGSGARPLDGYTIKRAIGRGGLRRGLLRHLRLRQGGRAEADHAQPRSRAPRRHASA